MAQSGGNLLAWVLVGAPCLRMVGKVAWEPSRGLFPTARGTGAPRCLVGVSLPTAASLPHKWHPCPMVSVPAPKRTIAAGNAQLLQGDTAGHAGSGAPRPDPSLFPIHWDWLRDQHTSPRSLRPSPGPSPQPTPSVLGQEQKPRPWEAGAGEHGEASSAWPWASSSLTLNYSVSGSACGVCSGRTPTNGKNRWLFNSSWPESSWLCCSGSCPPRRA